MAFGYAGVHQVVLPILDHVGELPAPQRAALDAALGRVQHDALDPFLVGLAVLSLVAEAARAQPLLVVIDDAQWLDDESAMALSFVGRRLGAERVAMLVAMRETSDARARFDGLRRLDLVGLPAPEALELLTAPQLRPVEGSVASRIVAATEGNPLALVELPAALTAEQLRGAEPLPDPLPIGERIVGSVRGTGAGAGRGRTDGAAAGRRRTAGRSDAPAPCRGRGRRAVMGRGGRERRRRVAWSRSPRPSSSAIPSSALRSTTRPRRLIGAAPTPRSPHALDAQADADRRAWHLGAAAAGPDERIARALEASAERARQRGGSSAAAVYLWRAAELTPDRGRAAERLLEAARAELIVR